jgi:hypothetical protein
MSDFDPEDFRLKQPFVQSAKPKPHLPKPKPGEEFIKGPVPSAWLQKAARLRGKALWVGMELWLMAGMRISPVIPLSTERLKSWGVSRWAAYRALRSMERAGLVRVSRHRGRLARVTILEVPPQAQVDNQIN